MSRNATVEGVRVSAQMLKMTLKGGGNRVGERDAVESQGGFYVELKMAF